MARSWGDYARDFVRNWRRSDDPLGRKLSMAARNRARAFRRSCCGRHGEPGC